MASYRKFVGGWEAQVARMGIRKSKRFSTKSEAMAWAAIVEASIKEQSYLKERFFCHPKADKLMTLEAIQKIARPLPNHTGIYFLMSNGVITYIGKSKNVLSRLAVHESNGRGFEDYAFIPCNPEDLDEKEMAYIAAFLPSGNKIVKEKVPRNYEIANQESSQTSSCIPVAMQI